MRTNNYFLVLDIETSTETTYDNKLQKEVPISVWLTYGVCKLYNLQGETKLECKFRKWETLHKFLCKVSLMFRKKGILCYVHNKDKNTKVQKRKKIYYQIRKKIIIF